ncbi:hypothetical protein [Neisseria shayeganii]|uniref:Prophage Lp2 protein 33 n=1 Tax=Neisseria shayeganii 871 TaxID=1032488 RepID=G4CG52_9NEIS|nr:hypothetical protein [Neisseria shayeganii]EGY53100.1 prophage Lp2 protein 33 [Neisseria shayeganii 871]
MKFRKKPVTIEAKQYTGEERNTIALYEWIHDVDLSSIFGVARAKIMAECAECGGLLIPTLEGNMLASKGDWIIRGVQGEFYPCKPDIFEATYEPAE